MGTIYANGINMGDLVTALKEIRTDWNATLVKLDADTGVTKNTFNSEHALPYISNIDYVGAGVAEQADIIKRLQDAVTSINAVNAHLDADSLSDTDYAATYDITDTINEATATTGIQNAGAFQGSIVRMLYTIKTNINGILAKLDDDGTVNSTNYESTNTIGFGIDVTGC